MAFNGLNGYCPAFSSASGTGCVTAPPGLPSAAPDGRFVTVTDYRTVGVSRYNGLAFTVQHRFAHGLQMQANYLYGHALDEVSNGGLNPFIANGYGNSILTPANDQNLRSLNYGNADYDTRHSINGNYVYEIPKGPTPALKGWQLSGTVFWRTGFPYTPFNNGAQGILSGNGFGGPVFANYTGSGHPVCRGTSGALDTGINPCLPYTVVSGSPLVSNFPDVVAGGLTNPATGGPYGTGQAQLGFLTSGATGTGPGYAGGEYGQTRNQFYGPHYFDTDMTIMKYTQIPHWETAKLGIGVQFFNLFNHPNFASPVNDESSPHFGQVRGTVNPPTSILGSFLGGDASTRLIQLTAKFNF